MHPKRFPVVEIFGPTIQGEGPQVGTRAIFVRFGGCDYRCRWCDSAHAVLPELVREVPRLSAEEIVRGVNAIDNRVTPLVVLSGGNPLLHDLTELVMLLHMNGYKVSVETQGSLWKEWVNGVDQVVVSPKPPSSGMDTPGAIGRLDEFLTQTTAPTAIKVPCLDLRDVTWAGDLVGMFPEFPFFLSVVTLMGGLDGTFAEGQVDSSDDLLERTIDVIGWAQQDRVLADARILPQVHYLLWGNERGH